MKLKVDDPDIQTRYGIDHYYQLHIFVPFDEVRIATGESGKEAPVIRNRFPVTCCATELPPGLEPGQDINVNVRFTGFNYKLWAYQSGLVSADNPKHRQPSPMFIGVAPEVYEPEPTSYPLLGVFIGVGFFAILGGAWLAVWYSNRKDQEFQQKTIRRQFDEDADRSLRDLRAPTPNDPDFSGLHDSARDE